jgi:hypothetical protein
MPTIESIAIIRHKNTKVSSVYTCRPYRVFTALTWLKKNNHLYESIELDWPNNVLDWQNQDSVVEPPYIELTDEEEREINEQNNEDPDLDERPSTNPGNLYANIFILLCNTNIILKASVGNDKDVLLQQPATLVSQLQSLRD